MRFLFFTGLLLAQVEVEKDLKKDNQSNKPKVAIDFFGKQISLTENDVLIANEIISKYKLPPSDIVDMSKNLDNIVRDLDAELRRGERSFAIYFVNEETALSTSDHFDSNVSVFISTDEKLAKSMNTPFPGVYGFSNVDKASYRISLKGRSAKNINAILNTPVIGMISYENFGLYRSTEMPLFYLFTKPEEMEIATKTFFEKAKKCRDVGKFVIVPYDSARITPEVFGFTEEHVPVLVCIKEKAKYNLPNVDTKDFEPFVTDVFEGKLEPFYSSQKEPENNADLDVKVLTRNNLPSILNEASKDRIIVFSSPDCGYCKALKPVLEELGKIVKQNVDNKVFVGSCDATQNDITDFDITGVPAIFLIKSGSNERIKLEGGDRTLENLVKFLREKGAHAIDLTPHLPAKPEEEKKADELPVEEHLNEKMSEREEL